MQRASQDSLAGRRTATGATARAAAGNCHPSRMRRLLCSTLLPLFSRLGSNFYILPFLGLLRGRLKRH